MTDNMFDFACHACRAADGAQSPAEELEVALDAMFSMHAPFNHRYRLFSAVQRRIGGQGMVQFASIFHTQEQVCECSCRPGPLCHVYKICLPCICNYSVVLYGTGAKDLHTEGRAWCPNVRLVTHVPDAHEAHT